MESGILFEEHFPPICRVSWEHKRRGREVVAGRKSGSWEAGGTERGSVTSWSECHLYRAMRYTLLAAMTGAPSLSAIVYFLDRDLAVMYGCGFARYTSHIRPSIRYRAITAYAIPLIRKTQSRFLPRLTRKN